MARILIAEDDLTSRKMLERILFKWGYEVIAVSDGAQAWEWLQREDAPRLVILDWMMPGLDGADVCRKVRAQNTPTPPYIIMLTTLSSKKDIVAGLQAGASDYLGKPFDNDELRARIEVGERVLRLQRALAERVQELQEALDHIKTLQGILPICSYCKKIRDDQNYWQQVESYIAQHANVEFSHSFCPECYEKYIKPQLDRMGQDTHHGETPAAAPPTPTANPPPAS